MTTTDEGTPVHEATVTETRSVTFTCKATAFGPRENAITAAEDKIDRRWRALEAQGAALGEIVEAPTRSDLRKVQLREWPDTEFFEPGHFASLAGSVLVQDSYKGWRSRVAQYLYDYPEGVFYTCGDRGQYFGFRYGTEGSDYISF